MQCIQINGKFIVQVPEHVIDHKCNLVIKHLPFQISAHLVEDVIGSPWIQSQELKYLIATLYNIGIVLYRNKELNKVEYMLFGVL